MRLLGPGKIRKGEFLANAIFGYFISLLRYRTNGIKQPKIALAKK